MTGKEYMGYVARLGCAICLRLGYGETPAHVHHPRTGVGAGLRGLDEEAIPLCPEHHQGKTGLHGMGRKAFERRYGVTEQQLTKQTRERVERLRSLLVTGARA